MWIHRLLTANNLWWTALLVIGLCGALRLSAPCPPVTTELSDDQPVLVQSSVPNGTCGLLVSVNSRHAQCSCRWSYDNGLEPYVREKDASHILFQPIGPYLSNKNITCHYLQASGPYCATFTLAVKDLYPVPPNVNSTIIPGVSTNSTTSNTPRLPTDGTNLTNVPADGMTDPPTSNPSSDPGSVSSGSEGSPSSPTITAPTINPPGSTPSGPARGEKWKEILAGTLPPVLLITAVTLLASCGLCTYMYREWRKKMQTVPPPPETRATGPTQSTPESRAIPPPPETRATGPTQSTPESRVHLQRARNVHSKMVTGVTNWSPPRTPRSTHLDRGDSESVGFVMPVMSDSLQMMPVDSPQNTPDHTEDDVDELSFSDDRIFKETSAVSPQDRAEKGQMVAPTQVTSAEQIKGQMVAPTQVTSAEQIV